MIKLVVGLGNPGHAYERTRHNAGFLFLDCMARHYNARWSEDKRFHGFVAECQIGGYKVLLLKPQTFMNRSGLAVGSLARYAKLNAEEVLVVHDELDLDEGVVKLKLGGGHAGHNGLRDIISHFDSKDFYRLRIGISRPQVGDNVANYVLSALPKTSQKVFESQFEIVLSFFEQIINGNIDAVMNKLHRK